MSNQSRNHRNLEKPVKLYFNRCFSTTPITIKMFLSRPNIHKFQIYISHCCINDSMQEVADYFEVEPPLEGKEYVDYCLDFCVKHQIDLFVPRYNVTTLIDYKEDFDRIGVKVMFVGSAEIYQTLESKVETYQALDNSDIIAIPKTFCVKNYAEFETAYHEIIEMGSSACMKPISGISGNGFKQILETMTEVEELYLTTGFTIAKDRLARILEDSKEVDPFIVMEYLEGDEYSIDCLANKGELIRAIPRRKLDSHRQNIEHSIALMAIAQKLTQKFNLNYLFNIQVKCHKGKVYLIEINTRMSGGIHKSSLAGVNFLYHAIKLLMGETVTTQEKIRWDFQISNRENYELSNLESVPFSSIK